MNFLQPSLLLAALPLIALPLIIHLINQRRYQTVRWAAMMFLLAANRMSRGYARLRQWLILSARMLAIAGLAFVVGRPLAGGYLGLAAGSRADATILILDRSPSMQQAGVGLGLSKLEAGREQLVRTLRTLGKSRWLVIDSATERPRELDSVDALLNSPDLGPSAAPSDLPGMLLAARDYLDTNRVAQADLWICSDLRENDWDVESGRWQAIRDGFLGIGQQVRFHLLAYPEPAPENLAIRVTGVRRQETNAGAELLVSLRLAREGLGDSKASIPVRFEIDGARSEVVMEMTGRDAELKDHRIAIEKGRGRGWGKVSIPADANPADNAFWFAFDRPRPRRAVIVAEDPAAAPLQLVASIPPDPLTPCQAEVIGLDQLTGVGWDDVALLLWQAPLPEGDAVAPIKAFIERGGRAIFFPPKIPTGADFLGARWTVWTEAEQGVPVDGWRGDQDLLAKTQTGAPLPVGQLVVRRFCRLEGGDYTSLATLKGGAPLLARVVTNKGGAYFCGTGAAEEDSSLASGGVVFYVMVQRALADGASVLEATRSLTAGEPPGDDPKLWKRLIGPEGVLSTDYAAQAGVYESGDRLIAVNRPAAEDLAPIATAPKLEGLFRGLDFNRVDDTADNASSLIQEVWRIFVALMLAALVGEAALCLPKVVKPVGGIR